mmetsp:Transcript_11118/g.12728  ORF Transcript_11118/g.12728 Transcript_11118/m.12728 type:complete len:381 (-) Transcript_11118:3050-4192(-)
METQKIRSQKRGRNELTSQLNFVPSESAEMHSSYVQNRIAASNKTKTEEVLGSTFDFSFDGHSKLTASTKLPKTVDDITSYEEYVKAIKESERIETTSEHIKKPEPRADLTSNDYVSERFQKLLDQENPFEFLLSDDESEDIDEDSGFDASVDMKTFPPSNEDRESISFESDYKEDEELDMEYEIENAKEFPTNKFEGINETMTTKKEEKSNGKQLKTKLKRMITTAAKKISHKTLGSQKKHENDDSDFDNLMSASQALDTKERFFSIHRLSDWVTNRFSFDAMEASPPPLEVGPVVEYFASKTATEAAHRNHLVEGRGEMHVDTLSKMESAALSVNGVSVRALPPPVDEEFDLLNATDEQLDSFFASLENESDSWSSSE